ncbi:hypothetical protein [Streptomyces sp. NPDC060194]|uniref:hypothetical protein n=1 Tax=Streptomyces sp. NPDC060194 TaxID=3347069 RepID=UPI003664D8B9
MQHAELLDARAPAHTRTRLLHWLTTAAALAAVVAGAAFVQPERATASSAPADGPAASAAPAAPPAADTVTYPLTCGDTEPVVFAQASGDLDGDGRPETVAAVRCAAGSGTPPSGLYVLTTGRDGAPRLVATFVTPDEKRTVTDLAVTDGGVTATLHGYSSDGVPRCCPDVTEEAGWHWSGTAFVRTGQDRAQSV